MNFTFSLTGINDAARRIWEQASHQKVWAIHGEMGAGKTTLIHAICENLQVISTVGSPTYSIINEYKTADGQSIYHIDLYRLSGEEEALQAGVEDCFYSGSLCFVEWPEKASALIPGDCLHVFITAMAADLRKIEVKTS